MLRILGSVNKNALFFTLRKCTVKMYIPINIIKCIFRIFASLPQNAVT